MPKSEMILFSSVFNCRVLRLKSFECLIPSSKNCCALMPSLAAISGLACAGGFIRIDAYVGGFSSGCWGIGAVVVVEFLLIWSSMVLMCLVNFALTSSISSFVLDVGLLI